MKNNPDQRRRRSIRLPGYDYTRPGAYFLTICASHQACTLCEIVHGEIRLSPLGRIAGREYRRLPVRFPFLQLDAFVIMPNHLHGIIVDGVPEPLFPHLAIRP